MEKIYESLVFDVKLSASQELIRAICMQVFLTDTFETASLFRTVQNGYYGKEFEFVTLLHNELKTFDYNRLCEYLPSNLWTSQQFETTKKFMLKECESYLKSVKNVTDNKG